MYSVYLKYSQQYNCYGVHALLASHDSQTDQVGYIPLLVFVLIGHQTIKAEFPFLFSQDTKWIL